MPRKTSVYGAFCCYENKHFEVDIKWIWVYNTILDS
jgi:hypothetical protein